MSFFDQFPSLVEPTLGVACWVPGALVFTHTIGSLFSSSSLISSSLSYSSESTSVELPPLIDLWPFLEFSSSSSSSSPGGSPEPPLPESLLLLLMTPLLAGWDFELGLLLLFDDLLEVLPELEPPLSLDESAYEIILSWLSLILFFASVPDERLNRQQVPNPRRVSPAKMMRMLRGVNNFLLSCCLRGVMSASVREGSCSNSSVGPTLGAGICSESTANILFKNQLYVGPPPLNKY